MSSPRVEEIEEVLREGSSPLNPPGVPASDRTGGSSVHLPPPSRKDIPPPTGDFLPKDVIDAEPIWYKYTKSAEESDQQMTDRWKESMNNLLVFSGLFTAIVTAFVLDVMSDLVGQSTSNPTTGTPPPEPPSSILTVSTLWFLSIMSSLAATTWAILCLESFASLKDYGQAGGYEEMAIERQRKFEAVQRWSMHIVVAAIPSLLHISLFLFLAGLWLRLREVNEQLGLIVAVPSLIIVSSYVAVTVLPVFTDAPFSTSASELVRLYVRLVVRPIFDQVVRTAELLRFILLPRTFSPIASLFPARSLPRTGVRSAHPPHLSCLSIHHLIAFLRPICRVVGRVFHALRSIPLLPILPTFRLDQDPLNELRNLQVGRRLAQDDGIYLRALSRLMNTPLRRVEIEGILEELKHRRNPGKLLDRSTFRLYILSLTFLLEDNHISEDERPIFDHCTTILVEEMDRALARNGEYNLSILFQNIAISEKLSPHFRFTASGEDTLSGDDYWKRAIPALWLCRSPETIRCIVNQLDSTVESMKASQLQPIVRGLHAATLSCSNAGQFTFELTPDFSLWSWDSGSSDPGLYKALSGFLQSLFVAFSTLPYHPTGPPPHTIRPAHPLIPSDQSITTSLLIVKCLQLLQHRYAFKLHGALCFFVTMMQRIDPKVLGEDPSVARAFLECVPSYRRLDGQDDISVLVVWLHVIAYGPKPSISKESHSLKTLGDLYAQLPDSIKTNKKCLEGFLDAYAATLEATLAVGGRVVESTWKDSPDYHAAQNICTSDSLFTHKTPIDHVRRCPNYKLPYLYSLAIALSYTTEGGNRELWRVADLLVTHDSLPPIAFDRALDTNILVVTVLRFALSDQLETVEEERKGAFLKLLGNIAIGGNDWRTRWKSIYLVADLACLFSKTNGDGQMEPFIEMANGLLEGEKLGRVPSDWKKKEDGLQCCDLKTKVKGLVNTRGLANEAVYEWSDREDIPLLSLYGSHRTPTEPISNAAYWVRKKFQRSDGTQASMV